MKKIMILEIEDLFLTAVADGSDVMLIDCGCFGFETRIEEVLLKERLSLSQVSRILVTHHDWDHIGALPAIMELCPNAMILCSREQFPYVTGEKAPLRPEASRESIPALQRLAEKAAAVDPGEVLPLYGGIRIVDTAGHQPGHISAYIPEEKTLAAGDALALKEGKLQVDPVYTMDMGTAIESAERLLDYDIERIICYHGGVLEGDIRSLLQEMIWMQGRCTKIQKIDSGPTGRGGI